MKMRLPWIAAALLSIGLCAARPPLPPFTTTPSGLQFVDMRPGRGRSPQPGQICKVLYRGWLYNDKIRGPLFDSAQDRKNPFRFPVGRGQVIPGWDEGIATMEGGGSYNQTDAEGFLRIQGLPGRVQARANPRKY